MYKLHTIFTTITSRLISGPYTLSGPKPEDWFDVNDKINHRSLTISPIVIYEKTFKTLMQFLKLTFLEILFLSPLLTSRTKDASDEKGKNKYITKISKSKSHTRTFSCSSLKI